MGRVVRELATPARVAGSASAASGAMAGVAGFSYADYWTVNRAMGCAFWDKKKERERRKMHAYTFILFSLVCFCVCERRGGILYTKMLIRSNFELS